jgi:hypothetical protein
MPGEFSSILSAVACAYRVCGQASTLGSMKQHGVAMPIGTINDCLAGVIRVISR